MPETLLDEVRTGLVTTEELDVDPYGFHVSWIHWDSGFRGTDLRIGDRVVGVNGTRYDRAQRSKERDAAVGGYAESRFWEGIGARDGTLVSLMVYREGELREVSGTVRADRIYTDAEGRRTLGPGGPPQMASDGFSGSWMTWLERLTDSVSRVLDGGWRLSAFNSRALLADLLAEQERVELLVRQYPGPFATTARADWEAGVESLRGRRYEITDGDLAYRSAGADRVEDTRTAAAAARAAFLERHAAVPLDQIPPTDAITGDRAAIAGRIVVLPSVQDMVSEAGRGWFCAGGNSQTLMLVDTESQAMKGALYAAYRYRQLVAPTVDDTHELIVRLTDIPRMVATPRTVYTGVVGEVVADTIGGVVFVDVTGGEEYPPFTGEDVLRTLPSAGAPCDLDPADTMRSFVTALKLNAQEQWESFFASWSCGPTSDGPYDYDPEGGPSPQSLGRFWLHARKMIMSTVYDVRVARVGRPEVFLDGTETPGGPRIEGVTLEMDPVGLFDGEYRAFKSVDVHRVWTLQRINGGPWRITSVQGI